MCGRRDICLTGPPPLSHRIGCLKCRGRKASIPFRVCANDEGVKVTQVHRGDAHPYRDLGGKRANAHAAISSQSTWNAGTCTHANSQRCAGDKCASGIGCNNNGAMGCARSLWCAPPPCRGSKSPPRYRGSKSGAARNQRRRLVRFRSPGFIVLPLCFLSCRPKLVGTRGDDSTRLGMVMGRPSGDERGATGGLGNRQPRRHKKVTQL